GSWSGRCWRRHDAAVASTRRVWPGAAFAIAADWVSLDQERNKHKHRYRADAVRGRKYSRRDVLAASSGLLAGAVFAQPLKAAAPAPTAVTPSLIDAARKEAKVSFYTALELTTSERLARAFEAK